MPLAQYPEEMVHFFANNFFWVAQTSQSRDVGTFAAVALLLAAAGP